jgi:hypothetical protein
VPPHQPLSFGCLLYICSPFFCHSQHKLDRFPLESIRRLVVVFMVLEGHLFPPNQSIPIGFVTHALPPLPPCSVVAMPRLPQLSASINELIVMFVSCCCSRLDAHLLCLCTSRPRCITCAQPSDHCSGSDG